MAVVALGLALATLVSRAGGTSFEADALPGWLGETHVGQTKHQPSLKEPKVIQLSWRPRAFLWRGFLSDAEADHIIKIATPTMTRSTVVDPETGKSVVDDYRSSFGTFIDKNADDIISRIEERVARWTFLPVENQEAMQVLRYGHGQEYQQHTDYFDEHDKENQKGGHRIATVLMYLSNVKKGGETVFPDSEPDRVQKDSSWSECGRKGVGVKPKKGDALLFWSLHPNATADEASMHAGCPVLEGEKWSATKWIHVRPFEDVASRDVSSPCVDEDATCAAWAGSGECEKNPTFMMRTCRKSCTKCTQQTS